MPETVTVAQWPVIVTVLEMPLMLTWLLLHVSVLFSLMPDTLSVHPAPRGSAGSRVRRWDRSAGCWGCYGKLGTLMLGMLMIGKARVDLFEM